jgi:Rrf2 family protein
MMLTKAGEYAVRCMLFLASAHQSAPAESRQGHVSGVDVVARKDITEAMAIPGPFLAKIVKNLARAGMIQIVQGARGGYRLLKPASEITLLEIIEAVEGEIFLNECLFRPESCHRSTFCGVHQVWETARNGLRQTLGVSLESLIRAENSACLKTGDGDDILAHISQQ